MVQFTLRSALPQSLILLSSLLGFMSPVIAAAAYPDPLVETAQGSFQGKYSEQYNISYFRKIPFGASTAGENRFRAPQPPAPLPNGVYDTDQSFDMCPQRTVNGSEDCLYLGLYSRPWAVEDKSVKRPVLVVFYGGGFIRGSASFTIPPSAVPLLNVTNLNDYVTVYPNYRTNAFGFLPGRKIKQGRTTNLNPGLLDQQAALQWVHKHISAFGGDPQNVTIWGQSAGAGSVVAQNIANGGCTNPPLFKKALASSPYWPKTYKYDAPEAEAQYTRLAELTGCGNATDTLKCLKTVDVQAIRTAALDISDDNVYTTSSFTWAPVIDGDFLQTSLTDAVRRGKVNSDFAFGMYNAHEGESFTPPGFATAAGSGGFNSSAASFDGWLRGFFPKFTDRMIEQVKALYPVNGTEETFSYSDTVQRAGLVYRDAVLSCAAYWTATAGKRRGYLGEYNISPAKHGSDTGYVSWPSHILLITSTFSTSSFALLTFMRSGTPYLRSNKHSRSSTRATPVLSPLSFRRAIQTPTS